MDRRTFLKTTGIGAAGLAAGGVAFRVGGFWWDQEAADRFVALSRVEVEIVDAIADTLFPGDHAMPNGRDVGAAEYFDRTVASLDDDSSRLLRVLLHAIDDGAVFSDFGATRFRFRPRGEREQILRAWDESFFSARRGAFRAVKLLVSTAYCEDERVLEAAGVDWTCGGAA